MTGTIAARQSRTAPTSIRLFLVSFMYSSLPASDTQMPPKVREPVRRIALEAQSVGCDLLASSRRCQPHPTAHF
jgi:hypothetical protein